MMREQQGRNLYTRDLESNKEKMPKFSCPLSSEKENANNQLSSINNSDGEIGDPMYYDSMDDSTSSDTSINNQVEHFDAYALVVENENLKRQLQDLESICKSSQLEMKMWRERYNILMQAIEQQDQVIAEIYAVASPKIKSFKNYSSFRGNALETSNASFPGVCLQSQINQLERGCTSSTDAKTLLKCHLDTMGFHSDKVDTVVEDLTKNAEDKLRRRANEDILNVALDRLLQSGTERKLKRDGKNIIRLSASDYGLIASTENGKADYAHNNALFAGIDDCIPPNKESCKSTQEFPKKGLTYTTFLERLSLPASRDILKAIRKFVGSILGPRGDGSSPSHGEVIDYEFMGDKNLRHRCCHFFQSMDCVLAGHAAWKFAGEEILAQAMEGIEKYVMDKISHFIMNKTKEAIEWRQEDEKLELRMQLLSFVTPDMLDVKSCMRNEVVWSIAEDELSKINSYRSPGEKIDCIVRSCSVVFSALNLSRGDGSSRPGADDFLPIFIFIVLHSRIPNMYSNCEFISAYRNPKDLMSKAGYCLVNLRSALEFISVLDATMLTIDPSEFSRQLQAARESMEVPKQ